MSFEPDRQVRLSAGTVAYRERGEGPPVLFIHGLLVDGKLWRKVVPALAERARCVVPDWPLGAHGHAMDRDADLSPRAMAGLAAELIERLDLRGATVVANDTGGAIAQMLVADRPDLVGRLVLTPCDAFENFLPPMFKPFEWLARVPPLLHAAVLPMRARPLRRLPIAFGRLTRRAIPHDITDGWLEAFLGDPRVRRDTVKVIRGIRAADTLDAAARLPAFGKPALVVWARGDRVFPLDHGRRLATLLAAQLVEVEDSYSFVPEDRPDALVAALTGFVAQPATA